MGTEVSDAENELLDKLTRLKRSDDAISGVLVEAIQSNFKDAFCPRFLHALKRKCIELELIYIADEIMTGCRT